MSTKHFITCGGRRWYELEIQQIGLKPMRQTIAATSGAEAKKIAQRTYGPYAVIALVAQPEHRLTPVLGHYHDQPWQRRALRGREGAFGNLQTSF